MSLDGIEFRLLDESDFDEILEFIAEHFATNEPTAKKLNLSKEESNTFYSEYVRDGLRRKISYGAYDSKTGELIAFNINFLRRNEDAKESSSPTGYTKALEQYSVNYALMIGPSLKETLGTENYFQIFLLGTKKEYGQRGIALEMARKAEAIAVREGCAVSFIYAASQFTYQIAAKMGYEAIREVAREEYVDPITNEKILQDTEEPHTHMRLMVKHLQC